MALKFSKNVFCPACQRKLCKITEYEDRVVLQYKHKGAEVYSFEMLITCLGCKRQWPVTVEGIAQ